MNIRCLNLKSMLPWVHIHSSNVKWQCNWTKFMKNQIQYQIGTDRPHVRPISSPWWPPATDKIATVLYSERRPRLHQLRPGRDRNHTGEEDPSRDRRRPVFPTEKKPCAVCTNLDATWCVRWRRQMKFKSNIRILMQMPYPTIHVLSLLN